MTTRSALVRLEFIEIQAEDGILRVIGSITMLLYSCSVFWRVLGFI